MFRNAGLTLAALFLVFGCTHIEHGRMGPWVKDQPLYASCKCAGGTAPGGETNRERNVNFGAPNDCGGKDENARNQWCYQSCQASSAGYKEGVYLMCLK